MADILQREIFCLLFTSNWKSSHKICMNILFHCNLEIINKNGEISQCKYQYYREINMKRYIKTKKHIYRKI